MWCLHYVALHYVATSFFQFFMFLTERLERGGPCWLVETGVNGDSNNTNERVVYWLVRWACHAGTRDFCHALAALVGPLQNIFFLTVDYLNSFVLIASMLCRQSCWVAFLSVRLSGFLLIMHTLLFSLGLYCMSSVVKFYNTFSGSDSWHENPDAHRGAHWTEPRRGWSWIRKAARGESLTVQFCPFKLAFSFFRDCRFQQICFFQFS